MLMQSLHQVPCFSTLSGISLDLCWISLIWSTFSFFSTFVLDDFSNRNFYNLQYMIRIAVWRMILLATMFMSVGYSWSRPDASSILSGGSSYATRRFVTHAILCEQCQQHSASSLWENWCSDICRIIWKLCSTREYLKTAHVYLLRMLKPDWKPKWFRLQKTDYRY